MSEFSPPPGIDPLKGKFAGSPNFPILLDGQRWKAGEEGVTTLTRRWLVEMNQVEVGSGLPYYPSVLVPIGIETDPVNNPNADPDMYIWDPIFTFLRPIEYETNQLAQNPKLGICTQTLTNQFATPEVDPGNPEIIPPGPGDPGYVPAEDKLPPDVTIWQGSVEQLDIRQHPRYRTPRSAWGDKDMKHFWDDRAGEFTFDTKNDGNTANAQAIDDLAGLTGYMAPSISARWRRYTTSQPNPGTLEAMLGDRIAPLGVSGSNAFWLVISGAIEALNGYWMMETVHLYSKREWPSWLYGSNLDP